MALKCKWAGLPSQTTLASYFQSESALSQGELAKRLGVSAGVVYFWKIGFRRPNAERRGALERLVPGCEADGWLTSAERQERRRLRRVLAEAS